MYLVLRVTNGHEVLVAVVHDRSLLGESILGGVQTTELSRDVRAIQNQLLFELQRRTLPVTCARFCLPHLLPRIHCWHGV